ncbi:Co/Zn/Cd efflux system component/copper chaperone CopZ [Phenylobacterium haematophilum]|jgi:Co/Zn/Cd efflux system component/copper chaperone CopZ|uniref:Co/Zn/Cd efflux system component/copper chaperone CopZ n=1 Tax=Phenylobacterium haematophilum TaxID=98513 RepID=A0A840A7J0_9CAUL|nr:MULTISPECIES: cation transporter [Phenylobacterium]MBB3893312.1 Co/Zn/Cd efflux system component/copper chaperone CopZ [Phenylobacterium haematophilum]MBP6878362.1 cation transporter [Phenylobacterium sp.]
MTKTDASALDVVRYRITGMDCGDCAAKIEKAVGKLPGVEEARVSIATSLMTLKLDNPALRAPTVEQAVESLGYRLDRLREAVTDDDDLPDLSHVTPAYKRALWLVVLINAGYGLVQMAAGFVAGSQALKADALDFMGDGTITFLGLLAIGWSLVWRARSALMQGVFLGLLGAGVLLNTAYRVLVLNRPEAEIMGVFGVIALVANVIAALLLVPHRSGDANAKAVWLFSRNDALGNLAVVIAAGLVAWTGTAWPDLVVAVIIAGLFLQSSWSIVRHARTDLREARLLAAA